MLGNKLKSLRKNKDVTLIELSKIIGVSAAAISDWENCKKLPRESHLKSLIAYYNITEN